MIHKALLICILSTQVNFTKLNSLKHYKIRMCTLPSTSSCSKPRLLYWHLTSTPLISVSNFNMIFIPFFFCIAVIRIKQNYIIGLFGWQSCIISGSQRTKLRTVIFLIECRLIVVSSVLIVMGFDGFRLGFFFVVVFEFVVFFIHVSVSLFLQAI